MAVSLVSSGSAFLLLSSLLPTALALPSALNRRHPSGIPYSSNTIALSRRSHPDPASPAKLSKRWYGDDLPLYGPRGGNILVGDITVGTQTFTVRFDTGSSDVWVPGKNITCNNAVPGAQISDDDIVESITVCQFAHDGYDPALNPTYQELGFPNNFNLSYAAGDTVGVGARDDITVGGITVPNQPFGIADECDTLFGWGGTSDGVFGLAGQTLNSIHYGSDGSNDTIDQDSLYPYDPWFDNAWKSGIVDPYVTFLLKPPSEEQAGKNLNISDFGTMSIGGIPANAPQSNRTVTVPNLEFPNKSPNGQDFNVTWWTAPIDEFRFPGSSAIPIENNSSPLCIFDTGQSVMSIPPASTVAFHSNIVPEPIYNETSGLYFAACDAQVPDLVFVIGGVEFTMPGEQILNASPLLKVGQEDLPENYCGSLLTPSVTGDARLYMGDPFFWNVMVTKDYKKKELTFTQIE